MIKMPNQYYFVIIGHNDNPLFELEYSPSKIDIKEDQRHIRQFIAHGALDIIDEQMWSSPTMYLKVIDKFNDWLISAFVTASRIRMIMLHDDKKDDNIRHFFQEVYDCYIKFALNPFYEHNTRIDSKSFRSFVLKLAKKYLV